MGWMTLAAVIALTTTPAQPQTEGRPPFATGPAECAAVARTAFVEAGRAFPSAKRQLNAWSSQLSSLPRPAEGVYDAFYANLQLQVRGKAADLDAVARQAADAEMMMVAYRNADPDGAVADSSSRWTRAELDGALQACQAATPVAASDWRVLAAPGGALAFDMGSLVRVGPAAYLSAARTFPTPQSHTPSDIVERPVSYQLSVTTYRFDCSQMQSGMVLTRFYDLEGSEVGRFNGAVLPMGAPVADPMGLAASVAGLACGRFPPPESARSVQGGVHEMLAALRHAADL